MSSPVPRELWLKVAVTQAGWTAELHRTSKLDDDPPFAAWGGLPSRETAEWLASRWAGQHGCSVDGRPPEVPSFRRWWEEEGKAALPCPGDLLAHHGWLACWRAIVGIDAPPSPDDITF